MLRHHQRGPKTRIPQKVDFMTGIFPGRLQAAAQFLQIPARYLDSPPRKIHLSTTVGLPLTKISCQTLIALAYYVDVVASVAVDVKIFCEIRINYLTGLTLY